VQSGHSAVLVLHGEAGIGKTALIEYVLGSTAGFRVVTAIGAEPEMELAYGGLHQPCLPLLDGVQLTSDRNPDAVGEWIALWDADSQHVAATGEHLGTVMWSDDGAVGVRGWYY
jgi:hypothetical protein